MTTKNLPKIGFFEGRECDIISRSGGWTEILDHNGKRRKVRNGEIKPAIERSSGSPILTTSPKPEPKPTPALNATITPVRVDAPKAKRQPDNGDRAARDLRGLDLDGVYRLVAGVLSLSEAELRVKYGGLNPGQQRMNLGNRLRGYYRKLGTL